MLLYSFYLTYPFRVDVTPNKFQDFGSAQASRWIVIVCFQKFHNKGEEATRVPKPAPPLPSPRLLSYQMRYKGECNQSGLKCSFPRVFQSTFSCEFTKNCLIQFVNVCSISATTQFILRWATSFQNLPHHEGLSCTDLLIWFDLIWFYLILWTN